MAYFLKLFLLVLLMTSSIGVSQANVLVNPMSYTLGLYLGSLDADEEPGVLENPSSNVAFGLAASYQSRDYPYLALDTELWLLNSEYDNTLEPPLLIYTDDEMELSTMALTVGARLLYPYDTPYRVYVSAGYGYYYSTMSVYANVYGISGYYEDSSSTFAPYLGGGFSVDLGYGQSLELYYRKWTPQGDFSLFNIPNTDIGGESVGLGFGLKW